jgi:5-methylcytosine-specific restriction protein A
MSANFIEQSLGNYYSWYILDTDTALKRCNKSVFESRRSGIPVKSRWFWGAENLNSSDRIELVLFFGKKKYQAYIKLEARGRTRIFLFADFVRDLKRITSYNDEFYPTLLFQKNGENAYFVEAIDGEVNFSAAKYSISLLNKTEQNPENERFFEGREKFVTSKKIERSPKNRKLCTQYHGLLCSVCGFNFEKMYGKLGQGFIEVHHIVPLSKFLREKKVDPIKDLTPLCSNCHRMIHRKRNEVLLIDELKTIITS